MSGIVRAGTAFAIWLVLPPMLAAVSGALGLSAVALILWFFWTGIVFPHGHAVRPAGSGFALVVSPAEAMVLAVGQWSLACAAYAWLARRLRMWWQLWLAPVAIVATTILVYAGLRSLGIEIQLDGP